MYWTFLLFISELEFFLINCMVLNFIYNYNIIFNIKTYILWFVNNIICINIYDNEYIINKTWCKINK